MAMAISGGRSRRGRGISDINVTPLVDVMLVLLVVFMVTAPLLDPSSATSRAAHSTRIP